MPDPNSPPTPYEKHLIKLRAMPQIIVTGATPSEVATIKAALNLLHVRASEKHVDRPNAGWGEQAKVADELETRIGFYQ